MTKARTNALLEAALAFAARGWPVFPCSMANKQPLLAAARDPKSGRKISGTGGVSAAATDPAQIRAWWKKWPLAMVGLATGHGFLFVVDFDPRHDGETGEEWTLERLKAELEAQIGGPLPATLAARTPSGGVHLYFTWPDDGGAPIRNRGCLPEHVDVRGLGGYVIAPPSVMEDGRRYRWLHGAADAEIAAAPAALVEVLRAPKARQEGPSPRPSPASGRGGAAGRVLPMDVPDDVRKYALAALDGECEAVRKAASGRRNAQLNESALKIASLVAARALNETIARQCLEAAAADNPGRDSDSQLHATIESGWTAGMSNPRDLGEIAAAARERASRQGRGRSGARARPTSVPAGQERQNSRPFRDGSHGSPNTAEGSGEEGQEPLSEAERARFSRIAECWLRRRMERVERTPKALTVLAWGIGRRAAEGLIDPNEGRELIWPLCEDIADIQHADIDRAIDDGIARGFDPAPLRLDLACAMYPMTDFGLAERFLERHGHNFRFTTGKGWLGWDGRRWRVLDQDKDTLPAELIGAVFATVRAVQTEARLVRETRVKLNLTGGKEKELELGEPDPHALDHWVPVGKQFKLFSTLLAAWGRQCEQAGKPAAIANLARGTPGLAPERWLTVPIEQFDCEELAINVLNGTLRFARETLPDGTKSASLRRDPHRREDLITKLAPIEHDPEAACPLYDGMIAWAQPEPAMRRYLHQVAGYASTGDTGEQKLWFCWGRGRNGKSTTIDSWCHALGDYSGTTLIETFLDQGIKKRGDQATPDLARLGGVRMLRASEPERGAKLNAALIKFVTGGEPVPVRALHRGFFDLNPRFKLIASGNSRPDIPDTDEGIWGRMKLVPWLRNIDQPPEGAVIGVDWPAKDPDLSRKIKAGEMAGVFNRLLEGLMDWLANGFAEPADVTAATQAYRDASDPLARFLRLCTEADPDSRVKSSELHDVFAAWCKAAGEKEWSPKGFASAMADKGFAKQRSDGMRWLGLRLIRSASDFIDVETGKVKANLPDDMAAEPPSGGALGDLAAPRARAPPSPRLPGDDYVAGFDDDLPPP